MSYFPLNMNHNVWTIYKCVFFIYPWEELTEYWDEERDEVITLCLKKLNDA